MKVFKKVSIMILSLVLVSVFLAACSCSPDEGKNEESETLPAGSVATATVTGSYTTPVSINYSRMMSNYYSTSADYQMLTTYEDGTYCFVTASTTASALDIVWSDTEAGAKCNPRAVSFRAFYGECAAETAGDKLDVELTKPFRVIGGEVDGSGNVLYAYDTFNWEGYKPLNLANAKNRQLSTADEWRLTQAWNTMTVRVDTATGSFEKATLTVAPAAERTLQDIPAAPSGVTPGPAFRKTVGAYISLIDKAMGFEQLSKDLFRVAFQFQVLLTYEDGTYCFMHSGAVFQNLWINVATAGNNFSTEKYAVKGATGVEFTQYYGKFTAADNAYDDTLRDVSLSKALRVVATRTAGGSLDGAGRGTATPVSGYFADSLNWTSGMGTATGKADGAAYLDREGFASSVVFAIKESFTVVVAKDDDGNEVMTAEGSTPNTSIPFLKKDAATGKMEPVR